MKVSALVLLLAGSAVDAFSPPTLATRAVSAAPVKKAAPAKKVVAPVKKVVAVAKAAPAKKVAPAKKAAPAKKVAPVAKAAPVKKAAPVAKAAPAKKAVMKPVLKIKTPKSKGPYQGDLSKWEITPVNLNGVELLGALPPVGVFDPAGLSKNASPDDILRFRECEIMHGRFAQMAVVGMLVPEKIARDGSWGAEYLEGGKGIDVFEEYPQGTYLTLALIASFELLRLVCTTPGNRVDAGIESLGWRPSDPKEFSKFQVRELQNGRLAMLAFAGEIAQELVNGKPLLSNLVDSGFVSWS